MQGCMEQAIQVSQSLTQKVQFTHCEEKKENSLRNVDVDTYSVHAIVIVGVEKKRVCVF